jgi:hypothetical protein
MLVVGCRKIKDDVKQRKDRKKKKRDEDKLITRDLVDGIREVKSTLECVNARSAVGTLNRIASCKASGTSEREREELLESHELNEFDYATRLRKLKSYVYERKSLGEALDDGIVLALCDENGKEV